MTMRVAALQVRMDPYQATERREMERGVRVPEPSIAWIGGRK